MIAYIECGATNMPMTIRLNDQEQEAIRKKAVEINKILINKGLQPLKDSEIVHIILKESITCLEVGESGKLKVVSKD